MTLSEFKAWFEGFTEGIEGAPTEKQFEKIKAKVAEITGTPITYPIYIDRYVEPYRRYWTQYLGTAGLSAGAQGVTPGMTVLNSLDKVATAFDSHAAMHALGKADAIQ